MYPQDFENGFNLAMHSEVGPFWNPSHPAAISGSIVTHEDRVQCGYVDNPHDPGGETKYGIAQNMTDHIRVRTLNLEQAKEFYFNHFWLVMHCDKIPSPIDALIFDSSVNIGSVKTTMLLQRALGITDDSNFGPGTYRAVTNIKDPKDVANKFLWWRERYYRNIVNERPHVYSRFLQGWLNRLSYDRTWLSQQK